MSAHVTRLLQSCPFLLPHLDPDFLDLATVVFGSAARVLTEHRLSQPEEDQVFQYFNDLAENGDTEELEILGTGAIELFNDDAPSQHLARAKLNGTALNMLEQYRASWGQPDYSSVP